MQYFSILTTTGLNKLIKATANSEQIILSQMGVSDDMGEISQDMQTLPNEKHKFSINSITQSDTDANVLICEGVISADVGGFYIRKVGIYADDGSLFAVGVVPDTYKPLLADGSAKDITIKFYLQVDNSANITLKVDNNIVLATRNYVKDEIKKLNSELNAKFLPLTGKAADSDKLGGKVASLYATTADTSKKLEISTYNTEKANFATRNTDNTFLGSMNTFQKRVCVSALKQSSLTLNLSTSSNFIITPTAAGQLVLQKAQPAQTGIIVVNNATMISGFGAMCKFRIVPSNLSGTEVFSYYALSADNIRMCRV